MKTKIFCMMFLAAAVVLGGCAATPDTRIKHNPELFASIAPPAQELIRKGQIAIGFTPDMVRLALGEPDAIAHRINKNGSEEIWRYQNYDSTRDIQVYGTVGYLGGPYGYGYYPMRYWGGYYGSWGWPYYGGGGWGGAWGTITQPSDYLRISFREGRVAEINQLR